jgi:hypothetical protein
MNLSFSFSQSLFKNEQTSQELRSRELFHRSDDRETPKDTDAGSLYNNKHAV